MMVDVIEMLVPAALHFGQEGPSSHGMVGIHDCVEVAAQITGYLGLVEDALYRCTGGKNRKFLITRLTSSVIQALKQLWLWISLDL